jgi:hypothetical protein
MSDATPNEDRAPERESAETERPRSVQQAVDLLRMNVAALEEYAGHYLAARADAVRVKMRRLLLWAVVGLVALFAGATVIVTAIVLVLSGLAGAMSAVLGNYDWAGKAAAGIIVLVVIAGGAYFGIMLWFHLSYKQTKARYVRRRQQQRSTLGRAATENATAEQRP